jgi:hypothetical protein
VAENGWVFWFADRDGELVPLRDIRTQFATAASAAPSSERQELAQLVVRTREPEGSGPDARRVPWAEVVALVESETGKRPTDSQLRQLFYAGGGKRVSER